MSDADIGYLLNRATRYVRLLLAEALSETGLTPQQAAVMLVLARRQGQPMTPREIAQAIDTDAATTSGLLDRLTRDGWLLSEPNPADGRSRFIRLTERAEAVVPRVVEAADRVSGQATSALTQREIESLADMLSRIRHERPHESPHEGELK